MVLDIFSDMFLSQLSYLSPLWLETLLWQHRQSELVSSLILNFYSGKFFSVFFSLSNLISQNLERDLVLVDFFENCYMKLISKPLICGSLRSHLLRSDATAANSFSSSVKYSKYPLPYLCILCNL